MELEAAVAEQDFLKSWLLRDQANKLKKCKGGIACTTPMAPPPASPKASEATVQAESAAERIELAWGDDRTPEGRAAELAKSEAERQAESARFTAACKAADERQRQQRQSFVDGSINDLQRKKNCGLIKVLKGRPDTRAAGKLLRIKVRCRTWTCQFCKAWNSQAWFDYTCGLFPETTYFRNIARSEKGKVTKAIYRFQKSPRANFRAIVLDDGRISTFSTAPFPGATPLDFDTATAVLRRALSEISTTQKKPIGGSDGWQLEKKDGSGTFERITNAGDDADQADRILAAFGYEEINNGTFGTAFGTDKGGSGIEFGQMFKIPADVNEAALIASLSSGEYLPTDPDQLNDELFGTKRPTSVFERGGVFPE